MTEVLQLVQRAAVEEVTVADFLAQAQRVLPPRPVAEQSDPSGDLVKGDHDLTFRYLLAFCRRLSTDDTYLAPLVAMAVRSSREGVSSVSTPHQLLEDFFDFSTLTNCETNFDCLESNIGAWTAPPFNEKSCHNRLLKICNALRRRASKARNVSFCGRILMFLASLFPLSEESGVNKSSVFNKGNLTVIDEGETTGMDTAAEGGKPAKPVDLVFHKKLWGLQRFFADPTLCYARDQWSSFKECLENVLEVFSSAKLEDLTAGRQTAEQPVVESENEPYFPKYLTSAKLLELQLEDQSFRRQVLVQMLILFQYLPAPIKFKKEQQKLTSAQTEWVTQQQAKVMEVLAETPPNGAMFAERIRHYLTHEESWIEWKNRDCPAFERQPLTTSAVDDDDEAAAEGGAPAPAVAPAAKPGLDLGSAELSRLWNIEPDNLDACRNPERQFVPVVKEYFANAVEQMDPANQVEKTYWDVQDPGYVWRSLRLLGKRHIECFRQLPQPSSTKVATKSKTAMSDFVGKTIMKLDDDRKQQEGKGTATEAAAMDTSADDAVGTKRKDNPEVADGGGEEAVAEKEEDSSEQPSVKRQRTDGDAEEAEEAPAQE